VPSPPRDAKLASHMTSEVVQDLPYASPAPRVRTSVLAGALILGAGLGMIALGGCFLMGAARVVTLFNSSGRADMNPGTISLLAMLYLCCLVCFGGAVVLLTIGTRALLRVTAT
jgi:hypothetical protein